MVVGDCVPNRDSALLIKIKNLNKTEHINSYYNVLSLLPSDKEYEKNIG